MNSNWFQRNPYLSIFLGCILGALVLPLSRDMSNSLSYFLLDWLTGAVGLYVVVGIPVSVIHAIKQNIQKKNQQLANDRSKLSKSLPNNDSNNASKVVMIILFVLTMCLIFIHEYFIALVCASLGFGIFITSKSKKTS